MGVLCGSFYIFYSHTLGLLFWKRFKKNVCEMSNISVQKLSVILYARNYCNVVSTHTGFVVSVKP